MEASIIFHFAGRGSSSQRLALIDFAQLLDPRWHAPADPVVEKTKSSSFLNGVAHSAYNFGLGGMFHHAMPRERRVIFDTCITIQGLPVLLVPPWCTLLILVRISVYPTSLDTDD